DIKFDYSYFVDNEPTKFIDRKETAVKPQSVKEPVTPAEEDDIVDEIDDEQAQSNSKLIPILTGAVAGLGAVLVVILAVLFLFTDVFKSSELKVPQFIGLNYESEIKDSSKYKDYNIEIEYEYNSEYEVGDVINQSPEKGEKIDADDVILLTINTNKTAIVNDVYGQSYLIAKQTLEAAGFVTDYEMVFEPDMEEGIVINTSPEHGDEAAIGSTVVIYVSSHTDADAIETPEIVGYTQEIALDLLKSVNLEFGEIVIEDSTQPEGTVIEQLPLAGDPIHEGDKVDIKVSSGKAPTKPVDVTVRLPYKNGNAGTLKVYLNNVSVDDAGAEVLLNSSTYSFTVSGSGKEDSLIVKIDGSVIYSCKIDFTADPIVISDEKTIDDVYYDSFYYGAMSIIPNVEGKSREDAEKALNNQGFYNITVETQTTLDNSKVGKVISQKPELNGLNRYKQYSTSTAIVIVIGKGVLG
ncbi:MAG: PASTA domain-containing protein, partial [Clostridia bacterium]|nr:PASTA domain-containing protein [Clostridia bacterium]